jgi:4'-phosphopantetheinyl transferase
MRSLHPAGLEPGHVAVRYARAGTLSGRRKEEALALLSGDERERYDRRRGCARSEFLCAHALLRRTLSLYSITDPAAWRFAPDALGKPGIVHPQPEDELRFSLSHTRGLVACAVAQGVAVGIDVESSTPRRAYEALAQRVLSPLEREDFEALPPPEQKGRFLDYWTLKEAHLKARGTGIRSRLDALDFRLLGGGGAQIRVGVDPGCVEGGWHYFRLRPTAAHYLAVTFAGSEPPRWEIAQVDE